MDYRINNQKGGFIKLILLIIIVLILINYFGLSVSDIFDWIKNFFNNFL